MGRLSPRPPQNPIPGFWNDPKPKEVRAEIMQTTMNPYRPCDACGHSEVDGQPISRAKWQIEVTGGTMYFCGHHFRKFSDVFMTAGYPIFDIREKVAAK